MKIPLPEYFPTASEERIQQYLQNEHYALWEVIEFGDSYEAPQEESGTGSASESSTKKKGRTIAVTTKDMQKRRNDVKARTTLLLALPDERQLRFNNLAPELLMYMIVWRNRGDLDIMSLDYLYNHLKVYEPEVQKKSESNSQNMAFISSAKNSSGKREVNTTSSKEEEQAPKALMAIDRVGLDWSYMANEEKNNALVADKEAPTEFTLMAKSSSSSKNEVFNNSLCYKSCKKNTDSLNTKITNLTEALSDSKTNLYHYKLGLSQVEARLVEFKTQEIKFCKKIRGLEFDLKNKNTKIERITNELEQIKKEKKGLDSKLTCFESASKDLDTLLGSQRSDKNKEGLEYSVV
nr:hypothetical protein [Tanacetum cinerariifolium]